MVFAPEDKRAWQASEVMAELEKVAAEFGTLDGPPPEAFEPLRLKEAAPEEDWEEERDNAADDASPGLGDLNGMGVYAERLQTGLYAMADNLRKAGRASDSLMFERAGDAVRRSNDMRDALRTMIALATELDDMGKDQLAEAADKLAVAAAEVFHSDSSENKSPQQEEGEDA